MSADYLFVYGTLRSAGDRPMHRWLTRRADYAGEATVEGGLYDLGPYPALVPVEVSGQNVVGELYRLHPGMRAQVLRRLDAYEGVADGLYRREQWTATRTDGSEVAAWVYVYDRPLRDAKLIPSGDYYSRSA